MKTMKRRSFLKNTALTSVGSLAVPSIVPSTVFGKNAPSNKIHVGQIGCGRISRWGDILGVTQHDFAQTIGVCDVDSKRAADGKANVDQFYAKQGKTVDTKIFENYQAILASSDIDAVVISTPDHWHAQPAIEAALAKKHIYLQKPHAMTIKEGKLVSDIVQSQGVKFQLGTQQRSSEQFRYACELVRNGRIGKVHTVKIGLPGDPSGPLATPEPIPENLDYDAWLGPAPWVDYAEMLVHPQADYSRPGWLRQEQYCAGMITGWGQHHFDIAAWGTNTEYTGPVTIEAIADFPRSGSWNVHGDFMVRMEFLNGLTFLISGGYPNGIRFEGENGWIFVTRGNYQATDSDPNSQDGEQSPLEASDSQILTDGIGPNDIHLPRSSDHHGNWLESIRNDSEPISNVEVAHRVGSMCLLGHIAMKFPHRLNWDPTTETFVGHDKANEMLSRPQRAPYGTDHIVY